MAPNAEFDIYAARFIWLFSIILSMKIIIDHHRSHGSINAYKKKIINSLLLISLFMLNFALWQNISKITKRISFRNEILSHLQYLHSDFVIWHPIK